MAHIGTRAHAREALRLSSEAKQYRFTPSDEWVCLKENGYRCVLKHVPTNVVYKINGNMRGEQEALDNATELANARTLYRRSDNGWLTPWIRIPRVSGFTINGELVLAMEFVDGNHIGSGFSRTSPMPADAHLDLYKLGFADMHDLNYVIKDGCIWPIDMGSSRSRKRRSIRAYIPDRRALAGYTA